MTTILTEDDVRAMIRERAGPRGIAKWCRANGIHRPNVTQFMLGLRGPGAPTLDALGLKKVPQPDIFELQSPQDQAK